MTAENVSKFCQINLTTGIPYPDWCGYCLRTHAHVNAYGYMNPDPTRIGITKIIPLCKEDS